MRIKKCPVGVGFDASTYIRPETAAKFKRAGYRFVVRYLRRDQHVNEKPDTSWPISLSVQELTELLDAGLYVGLVQFARFHGKNYLSAEHGKQVGHNAAWNAKHLGVPEGATLFYDAEWTDSPPDDLVMAELRAWAKAVSDAGYRAGVYVGYEGLSGSQWYSLPYVRAYWASAMKHIQEPLPRGWSCFQGWEQKSVFGQVIDSDFCRYDNKGARPYFVAP
jgi:hypothetical protein